MSPRINTLVEEQSVIGIDGERHSEENLRLPVSLPREPAESVDDYLNRCYAMSGFSLLRLSRQR